MSATLYPVHTLTKCEDYHHIRHVLYLDNWYTSIETCELGIEREIHVVGTVKVNRKGLPREGIFPKTGAGKQQKGTVKCMQRLGWDIYFTAWQDNKPVHLLSTFKPFLQKIMRKSATMGWRKREIEAHSLIPAYNAGMGGTDRMDQLNSYYGFNHKGVRWTHRILTHFLGVSVVNASILYNASNKDARLTNMDFFNEVIKSLCDLEKSHNWDDLIEDIEENPDLPPAGPQDLMAAEEVNHSPAAVEVGQKHDGKVFHRNRLVNLEISVERLEGMHYPSLLPSQNRRRCVFHPETKQRYYCETCDVALCLSECGKESCWYKFHHSVAWKGK